MQIDIKPHTIILLIGPSGCGKSTFCKNTLIPQLNTSCLIPPNRLSINVQYISSDDIRRELLGLNYDKYSACMTPVSSIAFELLYSKVFAATSFPVNAEFVIVDTKGTSEIFRKRIFSIAKTNNYKILPIIFQYNKASEYFKYVDAKDSIGRSINIDIKKINIGLRKNLRKEGVRETVTISDNNFDNIEITCESHNEYRRNIVANDNEYLVVSDVHGCYDEFLDLLKENGIEVHDHVITKNDFGKIIILNGDIIDNGPKSIDMIKFTFLNQDDVIFIMGNHENRLYKELTQDLVHIEERWFNTNGEIMRLDDDEKKKIIEMFKAIVEISHPFIMNDYFIITHAPANVRYLGKCNGISCRNMRMYSYDASASHDIASLLKNDIDFFKGDLCNMTYIFGHIIVNNPGNYVDGRIAIDGGCHCGGVLYGLSITRNKTFSTVIPSKQSKSLIENYFKKIVTPKDDDNKFNNLTSKEKGRIIYNGINKVNFINGTMSPCDKLDGKLESIRSAVNYFKQNGIKEVVMQPKYMGSRCNIYLTNDNETSYAISRGGYLIKPKQVDMNPVFDSIRKDMQDKFGLGTDIKLIIIDGELMPWSTLGEGLIKTYNKIGEEALKEADILTDTGFYEKLAEIKAARDATDFEIDSHETPKKKLIEKYGQVAYEAYSAMNNMPYILSDKYRRMYITKYIEQLVIYGTSGEASYKPFAILKMVKQDDSEVIPYLGNTDWNNLTMFNTLNPDGCKSYNIDSDEDIANMEKDFEQYTTVEKYEGVVIKPLQLSVKCAPYMKVRNPDYLTITYGFDYKVEQKFNKLYNRKRVGKKIELSIKEFNIGVEMLKHPYTSLGKDNKEMRNLYMNFVSQENQEKKTDPRL